MKSKKLILFSILAIVFSCQNNDEEIYQLKSNSSFTKNETNEILKLLNQFDSEICKIEENDKGDILECYQSFFERILKEVENGDYNIGINESNQKKIMETLNPELRKEFWKEGRTIVNRQIPYSNPLEIFPDTFQTIYIGKGKYLDFLENEISKTDLKAKQYFEKFSFVMDISPSVFADVLKNYKEYNIKDERIRLLIAIHYLTLNDQNLKVKTSYEELFSEVEKKFEKKNGE